MHTILCEKVNEQRRKMIEQLLHLFNLLCINEQYGIIKQNYYIYDLKRTTKILEVSRKKGL